MTHYKQNIRLIALTQQQRELTRHLNATTDPIIRQHLEAKQHVLALKINRLSAIKRGTPQ